MQRPVPKAQKLAPSCGSIELVVHLCTYSTIEMTARAFPIRVQRGWNRKSAAKRRLPQSEQDDQWRESALAQRRPRQRRSATFPAPAKADAVMGALVWSMISQCFHGTCRRLAHLIRRGKRAGERCKGTGPFTGGVQRRHRQTRTRSCAPRGYQRPRNASQQSAYKQRDLERVASRDATTQRRDACAEPRR